MGRPLEHGEFDTIVDAQGALQQRAFTDYATITQRSLMACLGLAPADAAAVAAGIGDWPFYADAGLLASLMRVAPCGALTNSDRAHGKALQARLGFRLDTWLCAEEMRLYKPNPAAWALMAARRGITPGPHWWHVSAYADYDLDVAGGLGLTTVFVQRPHARPGAATHVVTDLSGLQRLFAV